MRYRPFGADGAAVSNLTLNFGAESLARGRDAALDLLYSALEAGVNAYRLETADSAAAEVLGEALSHVERRLVCVGLTLGLGAGRNGGRDFSAEGLTAAVDRVLQFSGLGWIDMVLLDQPGEHELSQQALNALKALRATGRIKLLGVQGDGDVMDVYVSTGAFDILATPFDIHAGWKLRNRIQAAREQDMVVLAYDYYRDRRAGPRGPEPVEKKGLFGLGGSKATPKRQPQTRQSDAFGFLYRTPNWPAEAICLSYILSDPTICSVIVKAADIDRLQMLTTILDRDLPPGLAAQIEMGRVAASAA